MANYFKSDWGILMIAVAVVGSIGALVAIKTRPAVDRNSDGTVNPSEVPIRVQNNAKPVVVDAPELYDLTIASLYRTLIESFLHAFCYGCQTVFLCNVIMATFMLNMDERYAYLMTTSMVFMACMFMCMYSNNGVHIVTQHVIHFIYYGCAFWSLFFLWKVPDPSGLVAVYAWAILLTYGAGRYYGLPNYPSMEQIVRLYKLDDDKGEWQWRLASTPQLLSGDIASEIRPLRSEYSRWAITNPAFEVLNRHISTSFAIGVGAAVAVNLVLDAVNLGLDAAISLYISIGLAVLMALFYQIVGLFGRMESKMHFSTLVRFWPKMSSVFAASLGAAATVVNLAPPADGVDGEEEEQIVSDIVTWVGNGALVVALLMTYGASFVAMKAFLNQEKPSYVRAEV